MHIDLNIDYICKQMSNRCKQMIYQCKRMLSIKCLINVNKCSVGWFDDVGVGAVALGVGTALVPLLEQVLNVPNQPAPFNSGIGRVGLGCVEGEELSFYDQGEGDRVSTAHFRTSLACGLVKALDPVPPPAITAPACAQLQALPKLPVKLAVSL